MIDNETTNNMKNLSPDAQSLHRVLVETGGNWEGKLAELMFSKPEFPANPENSPKEVLEFRQWEVNHSGRPQEFQIGNDFKMVYPNIDPKDNYISRLSRAYSELKKAGLASERNNGTNYYWFYPIKK